ncbi:reverse transcriptase domain-containing protein, partial [Tanacetum coccineum]
NNGSTKDVQPPVVQIKSRNPNPEPNVAPVVTPIPKTSIPFPSRRNDERREIFRDLSFEISFTNALMPMPKFASTLKTLIGNKEKLSELARTPLNENCSAVILNKLPKKLGDPGRFLIPCEFTGITTCNALADLGASINLMPYSVWNNLSLPELTPTCMTLELADRSITKPIGIAEDVFDVLWFDSTHGFPMTCSNGWSFVQRCAEGWYKGLKTKQKRYEVLFIRGWEYEVRVLRVLEADVARCDWWILLQTAGGYKEQGLILLGQKQFLVQLRETRKMLLRPQHVGFEDQSTKFETMAIHTDLKIKDVIDSGMVVKTAVMRRSWRAWHCGDDDSGTRSWCRLKSASLVVTLVRSMTCWWRSGGVVLAQQVASDGQRG